MKFNAKADNQLETLNSTIQEKSKQVQNLIIERDAALAHIEELQEKLRSHRNEKSQRAEQTRKTSSDAGVNKEADAALQATKIEVLSLQNQLRSTEKRLQKAQAEQARYEAEAKRLGQDGETALKKRYESEQQLQLLITQLTKENDFLKKHYRRFTYLEKKLSRVKIDLQEKNALLLSSKNENKALNHELVMSREQLEASKKKWWQDIDSQNENIARLKQQLKQNRVKALEENVKHKEGLMSEQNLRHTEIEKMRAKCYKLSREVTLAKDQLVSKDLELAEMKNSSIKNKKLAHAGKTLSEKPINQSDNYPQDRDAVSE